MPEKILYILGAGASAQALPISKSVYNGEKRILSGLADSIAEFPFDQIPGINEHFLNILSSRFKFISEGAKLFGDVDTFAKYLHLTNRSGEQLKILKETLVLYFVLKQRVLEVRDSRYLPWLVAIMEEKKFPVNINIFSWNYDFQLQYAISRIIELEKIKKIDDNTSEYTSSNFKHYPTCDPSFENEKFKSVSLAQLNGVASFADHGDIKECLLTLESSEFMNILNEYLFKKKLQNSIRFVWENPRDSKTLANTFLQMTDRVSIIVIIGYSFPFYNRDADKEIFKQLKERGNLRKIYYQDPVLDGQQLYSQFNLNQNVIEIVHIKQTENFHIPFEY